MASFPKLEGNRDEKKARLGLGRIIKSLGTGLIRCSAQFLYGWAKYIYRAVNKVHFKITGGTIGNFCGTSILVGYAWDDEELEIPWIIRFCLPRDILLDGQDKKWEATLWHKEEAVAL